MSKDISQSDKTEIALLGEKFSNMQKSVDRIEASVSKLTDSGFVTRPEMQAAIKVAMDGMSDQLEQIRGTLENQNKIGIGIALFIITAIGTAIMKLVLKI